MSGLITTGSLLSSTFSLFRAGFSSFLLISFLFHLPLIAFQVFAPTGFFDAGTLSLFLLGATSLALTTVGQAALVYGVFKALRGEAVTLGECLGIAMSRWLPVVLLAILITVTTWIGFLLVIIPGIVAYCGLFVAVPALMAERLPIIDAFHRSWDLTEGYKLTIFGVTLVLGLIEWGANAVVNLTVSAMTWSPWLELTPSLVVMVLLATLKGVAAGVTYYAIRVFREGLDEDELAAIFD